MPHPDNDRGGTKTACSDNGMTALSLLWTPQVVTTYTPSRKWFRAVWNRMEAHRRPSSPIERNRAKKDLTICVFFLHMSALGAAKSLPTGLPPLLGSKGMHT